MTIYFVAGEVSADNHGAALMRSLRALDPGLKFIGRGGPQMKEIAGKQFKNWIDDAAVLGLWEVLRKYGYFREQFRETIREILESKPDAVVVIDYPGFNLRLARALRKQSRRQRIIYYISPQVWAWNRGRIKRMARSIDLVLCIFPFESDLYNESGLRAVFVGHPMIERLQAQRHDVKREPNLIGLFPGSRMREVRKIFPVMIETANLLRAKNPQLRFEIAAASDELARELEKVILETPLRSSRGEGRVRDAAARNRDTMQIKRAETLDYAARFCRHRCLRQCHAGGCVPSHAVCARLQGRVAHVSRSASRGHRKISWYAERARQQRSGSGIYSARGKTGCYSRSCAAVNWTSTCARADDFGI